MSILINSCTNESKIRQWINNSLSVKYAWTKKPLFNKTYPITIFLSPHHHHHRHHFVDFINLPLKCLLKCFDSCVCFRVVPSDETRMGKGFWMFLRVSCFLFKIHESFSFLVIYLLSWPKVLHSLMWEVIARWFTLKLLQDDCWISFKTTDYKKKFVPGRLVLLWKVDFVWTEIGLFVQACKACFKLCVSFSFI